MGRVPVNVTLDLLDEDALVRILKEPKNSIVKQYQKLFEMDGVRLTFTDEALKAVAAESSKRKTGARGLRAIMEQTMMDLMYEIPSDDTILSCQVTEEMVKENKEPVLERRENKEKTKIPKAGKLLKKADDESA